MNYKQVIKYFLPYSVINFIKKEQDRSPRINYNIGLSAGKQPKVFFSYVNGFLTTEDLTRCHGTRDVECALFLSALVKQGCRVDLARYDCEKGIRNDYDYVIGQGEAFRKASAINPKAKRILYLTENPPAYSLKKEEERIAYFEERHHKKVGVARSGKFFRDEDFENLDSCIFIGNPSDSEKIPDIRTYTIRPSGIINPLFDVKSRDYKTAKSRFMWIGSYGAVHKGLDILFDVFHRHPELQLYVLGFNEKDRRMLKGMLPSNAIDFGYLNITGKKFARLASECGFVILPSCSEGLATSVITGMNHGLIPIVTKETGIQAPVGEVLSDYKVDSIDDAITRWSGMDVSRLSEMSEQTIKFARDTYSIEKYSQRISEIVGSVIR